MLKVVIIGYGGMFINLIAGTLDAGCKIVGVVRKQPKYPYFIRKIKDILNPTVEYNYIKSYCIPELSAPNGVNSDDFKKKLLKLNPDIILVGSWGEKISKEIYNLPKIATINAHPSLLPKYRGPNPYFWVIKNKEQQSGITLHLLDDNYDTGAILAQEEVKIFPSDTGKSLKERTILVARGLICELLKDLSEDVKIPLQQKESIATYFTHPKTKDFEIDFKKPAEENLALIRASYPWYRTYFYHDTTILTPNPETTFIENNSSNYSNAGTVIDADAKEQKMSVLCGDGKVLIMKGIEHYKKIDRPFSKNYINLEVKIGDILI